MKQIPPTEEMRGLLRRALNSPHATYNEDYWWYTVPPLPPHSYFRPQKEETPTLQTPDVIKAQRVNLVGADQEKDRGVKITYKDLTFIFSPKFGWLSE